MRKWIEFLFLPLRGSHSSKGGFKKQYSTISDTVEVGGNYSGNTKKEVSYATRVISEAARPAGPAGIHRQFPGGEA